MYGTDFEPPLGEAPKLLMTPILKGCCDGICPALERCCLEAENKFY